MRTRCRRCGLVFALPFRAGPSGAFRLGGSPVRCPACGTGAWVRSGDVRGLLAPL